MNSNQLAYVILNSAARLLDAEATYGFYRIKDRKELLILAALKEVLDEAEWYSLPEIDIVNLQSVASTIILENRFLLFDVPVTGIYSNFSDPQTSFTYDEIR